MGMFSEIAEEMEEKAYRRGFLHGALWPVTVPAFLVSALVGGMYRLARSVPFKVEYLKRRRAARLAIAAENERLARKVSFEKEQLEETGEDVWSRKAHYALDNADGEFEE